MLVFILVVQAYCYVVYGKNPLLWDKSTISHSVVLVQGFQVTTNIIFGEEPYALNKHHNIQCLLFHWKWYICGIMYGKIYYHKYLISPNERTGRRGRKLTLVWFQWNLPGGLLHSLTLITEKMIQINQVVSQIWPVNVKSQGANYSSRHVYLSKYGTFSVLNEIRYCAVSVMRVFRLGIWIPAYWHFNNCWLEQICMFR